jgi:hypothetical protein
VKKQTRATYALAAATIAAAQMQGNPHTNQSAVDLLDDIIRLMEIKGVIPEDVMEEASE